MVRSYSWLFPGVLCQVDLAGILSLNPLPLSQGVLLSLLQQLSCGISSETVQKLSWMRDVLSAINPNDPLIVVHVRPIFEQVYQMLVQRRNAATTPPAELSIIRLLVHVINSMMMAVKWWSYLVNVVKAPKSQWISWKGFKSYPTIEVYSVHQPPIISSLLWFNSFYIKSVIVLPKFSSCRHLLSKRKTKSNFQVVEFGCCIFTEILCLYIDTLLYSNFISSGNKFHWTRITLLSYIL